MPRKTLLLIGGLAIVTVVLLVVALMPKSKTSQTNTSVTTSPTPVDTAHSILTLSPNPVSVTPTGSGSVNLFLDTNSDMATGVQLEATFDPKVIAVTDIKDGTFFVKQTNLLKRIDTQKGTISYALVLPPDGAPKAGRGVVATIQFRVIDPAAKQTAITISPTSLVSAKGMSKSVMKKESATGVTILISATAQPQPSNGINYNDRPF